MDTDPEVMRYLDRPRTAEQALAAWGPTLDGTLDPGRRYWAGLAGDEVVGWWGLHSSPAEPPVAELGYRLVRAHWGHGYATEGCRALLQYGFEDLGLTRVWAQTMAVNTGSRRVMERIGLRYERTFHEQFDDPLTGSELGEVEYVVTREEWLARMEP
jgi:RimJ/RimL family protein N-acetyltransferase